MFEVRRPIVNFLPLLILGVLLNSTLDSVHQSTGVTKTLSKKGFEIKPRQGSFNCLIPMLVLAPTKADPTAKEQSCNQGTVRDYGAGNIEIILALLGGLSVDCPTSGRTNLYRTLFLSESLPWCTWRKPEFFFRALQAHLNRCA